MNLELWRNTIAAITAWEILRHRFRREQNRNAADRKFDHIGRCLSQLISRYRIFHRLVKTVNNILLHLRSECHSSSRSKRAIKKVLTIKLAWIAKMSRPVDFVSALLCDAVVRDCIRRKYIALSVPWWYTAANTRCKICSSTLTVRTWWQNKYLEATSSIFSSIMVLVAFRYILHHKGVDVSIFDQVLHVCIRDTMNTFESPFEVIAWQSLQIVYVSSFLYNDNYWEAMRFLIW